MRPPLTTVEQQDHAETSRPSVPTLHLPLAGRRSRRPSALAPDLLGEDSGRAGPRSPRAPICQWPVMAAMARLPGRPSLYVAWRGCSRCSPCWLHPARRLRPGGLTDAPATGRIRLAPRRSPVGTVPRADVAAVIAALLERRPVRREAAADGCRAERGGPDTAVLVAHLYQAAIMNRAASCAHEGQVRAYRPA
jgi:hypothetical protein